MFIRSERLFLRPGWPEDWSDILEQIADERVVRNLAQVPWPYAAGDAKAFASLPQDARLPHFLITRPGSAGAALIGCVGLKAGADGAELGYWIGREHWGQGYATEAARAVLSLARTLGHRRITARHFFDNPASGQVLRKVGFAFTGTVSESFCPARGEMAPSLVHAIDLDGAGNSDGGDDGMQVRRAA